MRTLIRRWRNRSAARKTYYAADKELARLHNQLAKTAEPHERAKLLRRMADEQMRAVRVYHTAFGLDPIPHDNGRSMTESLTSESKLYRALGDVEHVVACNGRVERNWRFHEWGETADRVFGPDGRHPGPRRAGGAARRVVRRGAAGGGWAGGRDGDMPASSDRGVSVSGGRVVTRDEAVDPVVNQGVKQDQIATEEQDGLPYFTPGNPMYPNVRIELWSAASGMRTVILAVTEGLRRTVGRNAADWFAREAMDCGSYDELLRFVQSTVRVS
jgi:hypothetical protein